MTRIRSSEFALQIHCKNANASTVMYNKGCCHPSRTSRDEYRVEGCPAVPHSYASILIGHVFFFFFFFSWFRFVSFLASLPTPYQLKVSRGYNSCYHSLTTLVLEIMMLLLLLGESFAVRSLSIELAATAAAALIKIRTAIPPPPTFPLCKPFYS